VIAALVLHRGSCIGVVLCRHERVAGREEAAVATLPPLEVSDEDRAVLERWLRAHTTEQRMWLRARVVLMAADGHTNRAIAAATGCRKRR
jgi:hypothetical protein